MEDVFLWHIDYPEEVNWLESEYISWLIKISEKKTGNKYKTILDIPCGIGRHHKHLRENGFEVYGIDINEKLIEISKANNKGFENYYSVKDMREIDYEKEFDVVLNWFTSFGYFEHEDNIKVLEKFYEALKPNGILILDHISYWRERLVIMKHGKEYIEIVEPKKIEENTKYVKVFVKMDLYKKEGKDLKFIKKSEVPLIIYSPNAISRILKDVGFEVLFVFANRSINPLPSTEMNFSDLLDRGIRNLTWIVRKGER